MSLRFRWNGEVVEARLGDTVAVALAAIGQGVLGSDRVGRSRGVFCGMGVCQECLVVIDGTPGQRSCMTTVAPGMDVRPQHDTSLPLLASWESSPRPTGSAIDLAVIGAGPAGLNAAVAAAESGLSTLIIDERAESGGQYFKPRAGGYRGAAALDDQHRRGIELRRKVESAAIVVRTGETVWFARRTDDGRFDVRTFGTAGIAQISARSLILSTGAYEIPAIVPGWTLPGVMTIGAAQAYVRKHGVVPKGRIVIASHGPLGLQHAAEIVQLGGDVTALVERASLNDPLAFQSALWADPGLIAAGARYRFRLMRRHVPVFRGWELARVDGVEKVEVAVLRRLAHGKLRAIPADIVLTGEGFAPQIELARLLGVPVTLDAARGLALPERDRSGATVVDGLWVVGDAGGLGGARVAEAQGVLAGKAAARRLGKIAGDTPSVMRSLARAEAFQKALWRFYRAGERTAPEDETVLCRCEGVTCSEVRSAIAGGARDPGAIKRLTRLGMGRCQGRYCLAAAIKLLAAAGEAVSATMLFAPQLPAKPVPVFLLADENVEWTGHRESRPSARPAVPRTEPIGASRVDLAIVGGGIIGISAALFAARRGAKVAVLDRGRLGAEASGGNAGSLHLQLLSWDFGGKAVGGGELQLRTLPLQKESIALWHALQSELKADLEMAVTGGLMVAESHEQVRFLEEKARAEASVGVTTVVIDRRRIREIAPAIAERMVAAAWCPGEGKINPLVASRTMEAAARAAGAIFEELTPVSGLQVEGEGYLIETPRGTLEADRVLIAAGGWSAEIGAMLGVPIPVRGAPLQMVVTEPAPPLLPCLIAHADRHLTMKQTAASTILIGGAWTARTGHDGHPLVLPESLEGNLWVAARTVPAVAGLGVVRSWAAMNVDIDGAPLLGQVPGHPRVAVAATANGYTLGPLIAREVVRLVLDGAVRDDLMAFGFGRLRYLN